MSIAKGLVFEQKLHELSGSIVKDRSPSLLLSQVIDATSWNSVVANIWFRTSAQGDLEMLDLASKVLKEPRDD
jgi:hypothetical protein